MGERSREGGEVEKWTEEDERQPVPPAVLSWPQAESLESTARGLAPHFASAV